MGTKRRKSSKRSDWALIGLVGVVAVLSLVLFIYGPELLGGGPEFTVIVHNSIVMDDGVPTGQDGPGTITLDGNITNIGTEDGTPVVKITVFTGYETKTYTLIADPCSAGSHVAFTWTQHFDNIDRESVDINCEVTPLKD